jgi:hypothetical protein
MRLKDYGSIDLAKKALERQTKRNIAKATWYNMRIRLLQENVSLDRATVHALATIWNQNPKWYLHDVVTLFLSTLKGIDCTARIYDLPFVNTELTKLNVSPTVAEKWFSQLKQQKINTMELMQLKRKAAHSKKRKLVTVNAN